MLPTPSQHVQPSINLDHIDLGISAANTGQFYQKAAHAIADKAGLNMRILSDRLHNNSSQGVTFIGKGIVVNQLRVSGLTSPFHALFRLKRPMAHTGLPERDIVDLVFVLLTPERDGKTYLQILAKLSRLLKDANRQRDLRIAEDAFAVRACLEQTPLLKSAA